MAALVRIRPRLHSGGVLKMAPYPGEFASGAFVRSFRRGRYDGARPEVHAKGAQRKQ